MHTASLEEKNQYRFSWRKSILKSEDKPIFSGLAPHTQVCWQMAQNRLIMPAKTDWSYQQKRTDHTGKNGLIIPAKMDWSYQQKWTDHTSKNGLIIPAKTDWSYWQKWTDHTGRPGQLLCVLGMIFMYACLRTAAQCANNMRQWPRLHRQHGSV